MKKKNVVIGRESNLSNQYTRNVRRGPFLFLLKCHMVKYKDMPKVWRMLTLVFFSHCEISMIFIIQNQNRQSLAGNVKNASPPLIMLTHDLPKGVMTVQHKRGLEEDANFLAALLPSIYFYISKVVSLRLACDSDSSWSRAYDGIQETLQTFFSSQPVPVATLCFVNGTFHAGNGLLVDEKI